MAENMKSVMIFRPKDTQEQRVTKFMDWHRNNKTEETILSIEEIKKAWGAK